MKSDYDKALDGVRKAKVLAVLAFIVGFFSLVTSVYGFIDSSARTTSALGAEKEFDAFGAGDDETSWQTLPVSGITYEFAADFKDTYFYHLVFTPQGDVRIIKVRGELLEEYVPLRDWLYEDTGDMPEPVELRGVSMAMEADIKEFAMEALELIYEPGTFDDETFDAYVGTCYLDLTKKPAGGADFSRAIWQLLMTAVFLGIGICLLIFASKRKSELLQKQQRDRELLAAMKEYSSAESEEEPASQETAASQEEPVFQEAGDAQGEPLPKSNLFLGILGALGGSLVGVAAWVALGQIGFIAGFAGALMFRMALAGYEKFSGRLDKKGAIFCLFVTVMMILASNVLSYGISMCRAYFEYDASLDTVRYVAMNFSRLLKDLDALGDFYLDLIVGYSLSIWSSYRMVGAVLRLKE